MMMETKKRPLHEEYKLGAGEFCAILNGDDARQILRALQSFTKTVKREQRLAFGDVDLDDHSDDEEEDEHFDSNKKLKEEWMEDLKDYNVPFVGTSVAKGDVGQVVVGQWPTGFLAAYLRQSPLAVELTSDNLIPPSGHVHKKLLRQKLGKISYAIYRAYLQALSELITAAIPISTLKVGYGIDTSGDDEIKESQVHPKFMTSFMKDRFPDLVQLLNEETACGRGKTGSISGVGQLAVTVLQIMTHLASSTLGTSRQVVRSLDASIRDGVLKVLLREPRKSHETATPNADAVAEEHEQLDRLSVPYKTRASCIQLAVALLEMRDPSIASYISTIGSRERKNSPGILYLALRYGFEDSMFREHGAITAAHKKYLESLSILLQAINALLEGDRDGLLSKRALADLLGADALMNLSQAATCAPPLTSYIAVLKGEDEYHDRLTPLEDVGIKARRLLFSLLASASTSPFLKRISGKDDDKLSSIYMAFMVKALNQLLNASPSIPTQNFIIYSIRETPLLLPGFFRYVKIPDVNSTFVFLSKLHFVARVMKEGPPPSSCLVNVTDVSPRGIEIIMSALLPQHLNKQTLSRALQSSNSLTVFEASKLTMRAISRLRLIVASFQKSADQELLSRAFLSRLPDVQSLVSTRSKFDPFSNDRKDAVIVNGLICRLLEDFAETFPIAVATAKFDWMKLLPDPISRFRNAKPVAQLRILQTLEKIIKCKSTKSDEASKPVPKACCALLEICIRATHGKIYASARSIATEMLLRLLDCPNEHSDVSFCMEYEVSLWIDGMDQSMLSEFQSLLDDTVRNSVHHKLYCIQAWKTANMSCAMPTIPCTLLLPAALSGSMDMSDNFSRLVRRITACCQLFHSNPVLLATLIHYTYTQSKDESNPASRVLQEYARCILDVCRAPFDCAQSLEIAQQAEKLVVTFGCFPRDGTDGKQVIISDRHATNGQRPLYLRRCLQTITLIHGFVETEDLERRWLEDAHESIRLFVKMSDFEPIVMLLNHPAMARGYLPNRISGLVQLVAAVCAENRARHLDTVAAGLASSLAKPGAKLADVQLFDLLLVWFCSECVTVYLCDAIGANLARLATVSFAEQLKDNGAVQALALRWTHPQSAPMSTTTAWNAWIVYTSGRESVGECELPMIQMLEGELCRVEGEQACALFVEIHELGLLEFFRRCLPTLRLAKASSVASDKEVSFLSKAIDIGCEELGKILFVLTASDGDVDVQSVLGEFFTGVDDFKDLWHAGFFDAALASASQYTNDAVMRRSLCNTLKETKSTDKGFLVVSKILKHRSPDANLAYSVEAGLLLKSIALSSNENIYAQDELQGLYELVLLIDAVPQALKSVFKSSNEEEGNISFSTSLLLQCMHAMESCESDFFVLLPLKVDLILKSCLKFGISNASGAIAKLRSTCLKMVRVMLCTACQPERGRLQLSSTLLHPGNIWTLVLSHSKFTDAILPPEGVSNTDMECATEELVNLLVCCASLSSEALHVEKSVLESLLVAYKGGTVARDVSLRRLFHLLESMEAVQMPFVDEIGALFTSSSLVDVCDKGWSFLDNPLDMRRVHATLSQFPMFSYLTPLPLAFESWATGKILVDTAMAMDLDDGEDSTSRLSLPTGSDDTKEAEATVAEQSIEATTCRDIWRGRGPDLRYDPSFVVPLIVSALEELASEDSDDESQYGKSEGFVRLAQTLSENGGMSLCLASLSSVCPSLRKLAFSGLCLFLLALDSDAAKDLTTWRERPQLKMLITSVQVGFVLRKAMLASKGLGSEIPKLPSLSAIFLGKAFLILSKPGDAMYSAMNKYFLKLNQNHGAYNDMTRLPAFISLFCSSSEEHPEKERHWVLQCLRDSFLGGYHMVCSCHAPELLLTTLGRSHLDDSERLLILQVLTRLLQFGDKQAAHHLLDRIGLLPWLQALLASQSLSEDAASAVLDLVEVAVLQGMKYVEESQRHQFVLDLRNLLAPIADVQSNTARRVFRVIASSLSELGYTETLSSAGISISQCLKLLSTSDHKTEILEALCYSPLHLDNESEVPHYCETMLRSLTVLPEACVSLVLTRVDNLVRECETISSWPNEVVRLILSMHTRAVRLKAYQDCLTTLIAKAETLGCLNKERDEWLSLAASTVKILQENARPL